MGREGGTTQWAPAHKEAQRTQQSAGRRNQVRSALTPLASLCKANTLNSHGALKPEKSGQMRFLG